MSFYKLRFYVQFLHKVTENVNISDGLSFVIEGRQGRNSKRFVSNLLQKTFAEQSAVRYPYILDQWTSTQVTPLHTHTSNILYTY
jgi:hypothetical protein